MTYDVRPMREKCIDEIEGVSMKPPFATGMIRRIAEARTVPIGQLTAENLRLLVSQFVALAYTVPVALDMLERRPLQQGAVYIGDLLSSVHHADKEYALTSEQRGRLRVITVRALQELATVMPTDWNSEAPFDADAPDEVDKESLEPRLNGALEHLDRAPLWYLP